MGRDAELLVVRENQLNEDEIVQVNESLVEYFGDDKLIKNCKGKYLWVWDEYNPSQICASLKEDHSEWVDGLGPEDGQILECWINTRYYDTRHTRGFFPRILVIADWLKENVGEVYYCADDDRMLMKWAAVRQDLLDFYKHNGQHYWSTAHPRRWSRIEGVDPKLL